MMAEKCHIEAYIKRMGIFSADCTVYCVYINLLLQFTVFCELQPRRHTTTTLLSPIPAAPYHYMNSWLLSDAV